MQQCELCSLLGLAFISPYLFDLPQVKVGIPLDGIGEGLNWDTRIDL